MNAFLILWGIDEKGEKTKQIASRVKRLPKGLSPFIGLIFGDDYNQYEVTEVEVPIDSADGRRSYSVILTLTVDLLNTEPLERLGWELSKF